MAQVWLRGTVLEKAAPMWVPSLYPVCTHIQCTTAVREMVFSEMGVSHVLYTTATLYQACEWQCALMQCLNAFLNNIEYQLHELIRRCMEVYVCVQLLYTYHHHHNNTVQVTLQCLLYLCVHASLNILVATVTGNGAIVQQTNMVQLRMPVHIRTRACMCCVLHFCCHIDTLPLLIDETFEYVVHINTSRLQCVKTLFGSWPNHAWVTYSCFLYKIHNVSGRKYN